MYIKKEGEICIYTERGGRGREREGDVCIYMYPPYTA